MNIEIEKCPQCKELPVKRLDTIARAFEISCPKHGHMALGDTEEMAINHWNLYIKLITKAA